MKHYVYLAGPIAGLSYNGCTEWRTEVAQRLNSDMIHCLTPMRGKEALAGEENISAGAYPTPLASEKGITRRDAFDTHRASALFVNLLGAKKASIGTVMEVAWAWRANIPIIVIREKGNCHEHVMFDEAATYIVDSVDEGVRICQILLDDQEAATRARRYAAMEAREATVGFQKASLPTKSDINAGRYRSRRGEVIQITGPNTNPATRDRYPWIGYTEAGDRLTWMADGTYYLNEERPEDLIERLGDLE